MPPVNSWISDFLQAHQLRFKPTDFPVAGTEDNKQFVRMWMTAFKDEQVSEAEAELASIKLGIDPPKFRIDHLPKIMATIRKLRTPVQPPIQAAPRWHVPRTFGDEPNAIPPGFKDLRTWVRAGCPYVWDEPIVVRVYQPEEKTGWEAQTPILPPNRPGALVS